MNNILGRKYVVWMLAAIIAASCWSIVAQTKTPKTEKKETYTRPKPTQPIKPSIPSVSRYQPHKVFLEKADSLYRPEGSLEDKQVVSGNVVFRQGNMWMYCDSAYYFPEQNSMDAFGHVRMTQGDTLHIYADKLYYDGSRRYARLRCGPTQRQVKLQNRKVTLITDSLDYDLYREQGFYECGGTLEDDVNTLTSVIGIYSPSTKDAEFYRDVVLVNRKDHYRLLSDTLLYNTNTNLARIISPTRIYGETDTVITTRGSYNTRTGMADLTARSIILHTDSAGNVTTLEGDSIVYDKIHRISRAYAFRDRSKRPAPMVITDTAHNSVLIGGFGLYNDATREALASDYPLLKEFSRPDTIFLRADTIRTQVIGMSADTLATKDYHIAKAYNRARFFKDDLQGIADSIMFVERDSMLYLYRRPIVWSDERQVSGNIIEVHLNDSTSDWARLPDYGLMMEHVDEDFYNQLAGKHMFATFKDNSLDRLEVEGSVQTIFLPQEKDSTYNRLVYAESSNLTIDMDGQDMSKLKMWPEVTGDVTPIFLVKKSQKLLPKAEWHGELRPLRRWLDYGWAWDDSLGELSPELEEYFEKVERTPISTP